MPGFEVGHANMADTACGCTVVLCPPDTVGGVEVGGFAAGTRQLDGLGPLHMVGQVHAVLLTGGSSYGLGCADGVQAFLEEKGIGLEIGPVKVPIVPTAVIFDLVLTQGKGRPGPELGMAACRAASKGPMARGNTGAGAGATVGKVMGLPQASKGGLGGASAKAGELSMGVAAVVNAFGDVVDPQGRIIAGARRSPDSREFLGSSAWFMAGNRRTQFAGPHNTTLAVVTTNARLDKAQACQAAAMAQQGMIRAINPVHTTFDGDLVMVLASGEVEADLNGLGMLAARLTRQAIYDAVLSAQSLPGLPAARDLTPLPQICT